MIEYLLVGAGFAFAAAWQPGPFQAFLLSRIAAQGWRRTLPAAAAPLISDGPIAVIVLLLLRNVPPSLERGLQAAGGVVLLLVALQTWREWRRGPVGPSAGSGRRPRTVWEAALVNAINPGPWLGWSLVLGPVAVEAWRVSRAHAAVLVGSFYVVMFVNLVVFIVLLGATGRLKPGGRRALHLLTVVVLAGLGLLRLVTAVF